MLILGQTYIDYKIYLNIFLFIKDGTFQCMNIFYKKKGQISLNYVKSFQLLLKNAFVGGAKDIFKLFLNCSEVYVKKKDNNKTFINQ